MSRPRFTFRVIPIALAAWLAVLAIPSALRADESPGLVHGVVRGQDTNPIEAAHVYAYSLADKTFHRVLTDVVGKFRFDALPAGLYQIIAYKSGFMPAVVALTRPAAERVQVLDLDLVRQGQAPAADGLDYFELRRRMPDDVLREIETLEVLQAAVPRTSVPTTQLDLAADRLSGGVEASAGVDSIAGLGNAEVSGGHVAVRSQLDTLSIGLQGDYKRLDAGSAFGSLSSGGTASQLSLDLEGRNDTRINVTSASSRLVDRGDETVGFDHLSLSYAQRIGDGGVTASAHLTDESNFYRRDVDAPAIVSEASRTVEVQGEYSTELGDRSSLAAGLRYRERQSGLSRDPRLPMIQAERIDLFGRGGFRVRPAVLIEYGVYSVLSDGNLSLAPQGGVVVQLSSEWQALGRVSGRVVDDRVGGHPGDFLPRLHESGQGTCDRAEEICYQLQLVKTNEEDESLTIGAVHREFGETLRLYFNTDFFDRQESLYLVPGDRLPEFQVSLERHLSPNILTRLQSDYAAGGGGLYYATSEDAYENEVRYLITSIDTQFKSTSTGVFVAFHQVDQTLKPFTVGEGSITPLASQRLQLAVRQDLDVLLDLPADWALRINMEFSRNLQEGADPDLRRRVLGGIAVKF